MTSTIRTTLTGAALVAAITLGGFTSAYAQFQQPFGEPYTEELAIENVATDESPNLLDEDALQMDGASTDHNVPYETGHGFDTGNTAVC